MLVLGIDPGIAITGYGLVKVSQAGDLQVVTFGVLDSTAVRATSSRLVYLYDRLTSLITQYQPSFAAVERLFFQKNIKTAMEVSEARGVIELCLEQAHIKHAAYTPNEVKQSVTSNGNANKKQVQEMVKILLQMEDLPTPDDAADALAVALCHINWLNFSRSLPDEET